MMTYPWPDEGAKLDAISTPMPVIDEDRLAANIKKAQAYLDSHGKAFRPHIKTHKIPAIARQQLQAGAIGINCQKVSEAEVFADAGFDDILITYNILGAAKLSRLKALNSRIAQLSVVADSDVTVAGLAATFDEGGRSPCLLNVIPAESVAVCRHRRRQRHLLRKSSPRRDLYSRVS